VTGCTFPGPTGRTTTLRPATTSRPACAVRMAGPANAVAVGCVRTTSAAGAALAVRVTDRLAAALGVTRSDALFRPIWYPAAPASTATSTVAGSSENRRLRG
jgi:hypothetical protein